MGGVLQKSCFSSIALTMRITLLRGEKLDDYKEKLSFIEGTLYVEPPESIRDIDEKTTDLVYIVPMDFVETPNWAETRIRLARACRYFVVCGKNLTTEKIISYSRDGAFDVLDLTDSVARWSAALHEATGSQSLWWQLYGGYTASQNDDMIGRSDAIKSLKQSASIIGPTNASVLVLGDSGVGKERVAQSVHNSSGKKNFVAVNCAAIPKDLIESELFGVEKGAYTGAVKDKLGLIQEADGGTLFLDEIGELDIMLQPKLLRFLETRKARRIGSTEEYSVDLRVICATNRDLEAEIAKSQFRADLYYRISEVILTIPPLNQRTEDIPLLSQAFLKMSGERFGKNFESIEPELITRFQAYEWPGNIRELKQAVDRLVILNNGHVLRSSWWEMPVKPLEATQQQEAVNQFYGQGTHPPMGAVGTHPGFASPTEVQQQSYTSPSGYGDPAGFAPSPHPPNRKEKFEYAKRLLKESDNDFAWVSARMGIHPTTLYRWRMKNKV